MVGLNLIWFVLTILVIPAFPAAGALYYATNRIAHGEMAGLGLFFDGFKEYFWTSMKWGALNSLVYLLLAVNIWFYGQFEGWGFLILQSLFFSLALIYSCMMIYIYPFLLEQENPVLKHAIRNSFAAFGRFMGRSFGLLLLFIVLVVVSILLPPLLLVITVSLMAYLSNWQTIQAVRNFQDEANKRE
jgi:uncharacterized membrane protein YesL